MPTRHFVTGPRLWLALLTVYLVWGSTYFGIAVAIESMPPFVMLAGRFLVAGGLLFMWEVLRNRGSMPWPTRREWRDSAIVGGLLLGIGNGFVAYGEQTVPSGIAAILIALMPVWLAVLGWLYFRERLPRIVALGVAVGIAGVVLLVWPFGAGANGFDAIGIAALLLSPVGWAHGSLFSAHRARLPHRPLLATSLQMLTGAAFLLVEAVLTGELARFHPEAVTTRSLIAFVYLTVIGSMVAFSAFAWLLRHAPLSLIGTYAYVNPVVAVALGTVLLGESISRRTVVASIVILAAVAMIVTARGRLARMSGGDAEDVPDAAEDDDYVEPVAVIAPPKRPVAAPRRLLRPAAPPRARSG
jgi:drug/metabolite transporter (DMT)-like permease